jgi:SAM-dependent methyltransferase
MQEYYNRRASEYEQIYNRDDPTRQAELQQLASDLRAAMAGIHVLELAAGTGYWTAIAADAAASILATDLSEEMLAIARSKGLPPQQVRFLIADAYALETIPGTFDAAFGNFLFSHVPRARITEFLSGLCKRLAPGSTVFMADNIYVPGVGGKLVQTPESEDTYKLRLLADGSEHMVLKNYFSEQELYRLLSPNSSELRITFRQCFWWATFRTP